MRLHQHHQFLGGEQLQQLGFLQHHGSVNADALSQEGMFYHFPFSFNFRFSSVPSSFFFPFFL
jgi:hypothetical protein